MWPVWALAPRPPSLLLSSQQLSRGQDDEVREYAAAVLEEVNRLLGGVLQVGPAPQEERGGGLGGGQEGELWGGG